MALEGAQFVPQAAFEPGWFSQTFEYLSERAEDVSELTVFLVSALALAGGVVGAAAGIRGLGRAVGGRGRSNVTA